MVKDMEITISSGMRVPSIVEVPDIAVEIPLDMSRAIAW